MRVEEPVEDSSFEAPSPYAVDPGQRDGFGNQPVDAGRYRPNREGSPIPNVGVTILASNGHQLLRTATDQEGRYAATGLPQDFVTVLLLTAGRTPAIARLLVTGGRTFRQDFILDAPVHRPLPA